MAQVRTVYDKLSMTSVDVKLSICRPLEKLSTGVSLHIQDK